MPYIDQIRYDQAAHKIVGWEAATLQACAEVDRLRDNLPRKISKEDYEKLVTCDGVGKQAKIAILDRIGVKRH